MDSHRSHCKHQFTDRQHVVFTTYHSLQNGLTPLTLQTPVYWQTACSIRHLQCTQTAYSTMQTLTTHHSLQNGLASLTLHTPFY